MLLTLISIFCQYYIKVEKVLLMLQLQVVAQFVKDLAD